MATQLSIAQQLNLSKATVSRILSGTTSHHDETRARVLALAAQLGYRHLRPTVRQRRTRARGPLVIGIIMEVNDATPPEAPAVTLRALRGISSAARTENVGVRVEYLPVHERRQLSQHDLPLLRDRQLGGLILAGGFTPEVIRELARKVPCVRLNNRECNVEVDCVGQNDADAVERLIGHLEARGHRRIGFVRGGEDEWPTKARQASYLGAMAQRGPEDDLRLIVRPAAGADADEWDRCHQRVGDQVERGVRAWICEDDGVGYSLLRWLQRHGWQVPRDVSVCAFDHLDAPAAELPKLTSIDWPFEDIGAAALRRLLRRVQEPSAPPVYMQLNGRLVEGRSTGRCRR